MRKVEKRAKEEEERQARDHLERHKASTALTESWVAACAKAELRSQKQTAAAEASLGGDSASFGSQDQWRKKRRHALTGADESDEDDNDDTVTQEETEDLYNKVNAEQKSKEATPTDSASAPKLTGLQALFAKRASSAATLQSIVRTARLRREFIARREAAVGIQALVRGMLARDDVFEIRMDLIAKLKAEKAKKIADAKAARAAKAKQKADEEAKAAAEAELAAAAEIDWGAEGLDDAFSVTATNTPPQQQQSEADTDADGIDWTTVDLQQMDILASKQTHEEPANDDPFANMDDSALAALEQGVSTQ